MSRIFNFESGGIILRITVFSDRILRITFGKNPDAQPNSMTVTADTNALPEVSAVLSESDTAYRLSTSVLTAVIDRKTLDICFERADGSLLSSLYGQTLTEYDVYGQVGGRIETKQTVDGTRSNLLGGEKVFVRKSNHGKLNLRFTEDEELYGLGSHEEGYPSLKGQFVPLYQENMRIAVPYMVSTKGYAYLFDCASHINFDGTDVRYGRLWFDSLDNLDYYFICGGDFDEVCRGYRTLTGVTPMLPKWAVGYVQSRERYISQKHILETAAKYREIGVPLDCIVQDWHTWPDNLWGYKCFDPARYPDPDGMMEALHGMNLHMILSIWVNMHGDSADRLEFKKAGKLLGNDSTYDAFDPEARALYWRQANEGIFSHGIDGWWCDSTEPFETIWGGEERPPLPERMNISTDTFKKYLDDSVINVYSLLHSMGIYENQRKTTEEKRVLNLTRSGFAGQHRYGTIVWSGDVSATWETLARQIAIVQNYTACGEAYWSTDAGGFFVKQWRQWFGDGDYPAGCEDLGFRELYTRWLQFGGFTTFMRSHGTDTPREVWQFGERGTMFRDAIEETIALRYRLAPYFYSINAAVTFDGTMPVTALGLAYPNDRTARKISTQYMYGHELLVCPVTHPMYYTAGSEEVKNPDRYLDVYLPAGCGWYDFYTEEYFVGGQYIRVPVTIDRIPLFVRAGAILPISPVMQYVDEDPSVVCEVRVYTGRDGSFMLYNDSGDGYGYENGEYTAVKITYDDETGCISEELMSGCNRFRRNTEYRIIGRN